MHRGEHDALRTGARRPLQRPHHPPNTRMRPPVCSHADLREPGAATQWQAIFSAQMCALRSPVPRIWMKDQAAGKTSLTRRDTAALECTAVASLTLRCCAGRRCRVKGCRRRTV